MDDRRHAVGADVGSPGTWRRSDVGATGTCRRRRRRAGTRASRAPATRRSRARPARRPDRCPDPAPSGPVTMAGLAGCERRHQHAAGRRSRRTGRPSADIRSAEPPPISPDAPSACPEIRVHTGHIVDQRVEHVPGLPKLGHRGVGRGPEPAHAGAPVSLADRGSGWIGLDRRTTCVIISTVADSPAVRLTRAVPSSAVTRSRPRPSRDTGSGAAGRPGDVHRRRPAHRVGWRAGVDRVGS